MNYRHAFHAGNFADVFKHVLLSRIILALGRKPTPFRYIDTHSGIGWYDLGSDEARRGGEWKDGIGRLLAAEATGAVAALLQPYLDAVGPRDAEGRPLDYPGSPAVAQHLARAGDRLILCERHPVDVETLREAVKGDRRAKVVAIDGYMGLNAYVPPPERRGLVLIDPPFEERGEFDTMTAALEKAYRKWPTGLYALWYPIKDRAAVVRFGDALAGSTMKKVAQVELIVDAAALAQGTLAGCGMVLVNPPFSLEEEAATILPFLAQVLGRQEPGSWRWRSLRSE